MRRRVSVIITAHDAEARIEIPLRALGAQRLPPDVELEVIVVDDRSTDLTGARAQCAAAAAGLGLRLVRLDDPPSPGVSARVAALEAGMSRADTHALLLLDDDACIGPTYVATLLQQLQHAEIVAPPLRYRAADAGFWATALAAFQSIDAAYYHAVATTVARSGAAPGVCFGGIALRRDVLDRIGGLSALGFTLVEDLAFARAAHRCRARFAFPREPGVQVAGVRRPGALLERALRVSATGGVSLLASALVLPIATLPVIAVLCSVGTMAWSVLLARWLCGALVLRMIAVRRGSRPSVGALLLFEFATIVLAIAVAIRVRQCRDIRWGGVTYARRATGVSGHEARRVA